MITRRQFLIGSATGLILPNWLLEAEQYLRNEGEPLLESPIKTNSILTAFDEGNGYTLYLDYDPDIAINFTWKEMIDRYQLTGGEPVEDYDWTLRSWGFKGDLNERVHDFTAFDFWLKREGPTVQAYELLEKLDIGPALKQGKLAGNLIFAHGFSPGDWTPHVIAEDGITLSLLQKRLNDLNAGVEVITSFLT